MYIYLHCFTLFDLCCLVCVYVCAGWEGARATPITIPQTTPQTCCRPAKSQESKICELVADMGECLCRPARARVCVYVMYIDTQYAQS